MLHTITIRIIGIIKPAHICQMQRTSVIRIIISLTSIAIPIRITVDMQQTQCKVTAVRYMMMIKSKK